MAAGKVYVGGLPDDATSKEIEDAFYKFGRIYKVWVARRPPGFAFVEYEDQRDAEDAVRAMDGARVCGARVRVELSHGRRRNGNGDRGDRDGGGGRGGDRYGGGGSRRSRSRSGGRGGRSRSRDRERDNSRSRSRSPRSRTRSKSPADRSRSQSK
ncbi:unnamed protein product, partial [Mesorhabditis belari]|uniref:RRM domain-containing protein n=1 Tax=Mesorhabditis belari TaxID=2138241 RepID=A0AAF3ECN5_9BILA